MSNVSNDAATLNYVLCSIKALVVAAYRQTWQDGCIGEDIGLVSGATFLLETASNELTEQSKNEGIGGIGYELCSIKALVDAAYRQIWQDGSTAEDIGLVTDAAFLIETAEKQLTALIEANP